MERIGCGAGSHIVSTWTLHPRHASRYRELQRDIGKASPRIAHSPPRWCTGELPIRTGLTTVGRAGATVGIPDEAPTIATALKALGYETGQFGKNHLGDLNRYLPTVHGFDEYFGYLYHLDAMEDPFWHSCPAALKGKQFGDRNYKVHLDGYDQTNVLTGRDRPTAMSFSTLRRVPWARCASTTGSSGLSTSPRGGSAEP
jgi:hypothetical protein